jgi:hypothetical protein
VAEPDGPVSVALPRRIDRRMRLGPFPSARDAVKFAAYAALGTIALPFGGPVAWLPLVGAGFLLAVYRPGGKGIDETASDYLRWQLRRRRPPRAGRATGPVRAAQAWLKLPGPVAAAVVEAGGVPTRFLPPDEARALFARYRSLLRTVGGGLVLEIGLRPLEAGAYGIGEGAPVPGPEAAARAGYIELVDLLVERRRRRAVACLLYEPWSGAASAERLLERVRLLEEGLRAIGTEPERLTGARLRASVALIGWSGPTLR